MAKDILSRKILVLGVDGADPRLTRTYLDQGLLPNTAELLKRGAAREDLVMLGGQPTVTPPMWTTLATGAYPCTHGITCFNRKGNDLDETMYNLDSRYCKAEPMWNVTASNQDPDLPAGSQHSRHCVASGPLPPVFSPQPCLILWVST